MERRQLLRRGLLLGSVAVAGCGGTGGSTETADATTDTDPTTTAGATPTATAGATPTETATRTATETSTATPTATPSPPNIPPTIERTFDSSAAIGSFDDVVALDSGGYVFAGASGSASGSKSAWLVRTDSQGTQQWSNTYGTGSTSFASVIQTGDGTVVAAGQIQGSDGSTDGYVQGVNPTDGSSRWSNTLERDSNSFLKGVAESASGVVVTGVTALTQRGTSSGWVLRLDEQGRAVTEQSLSTSFFILFNQVVATGDGQYALVGARSEGRGTADGYLVVVDDQLRTQFSQQYSEGTFDGFRDAITVSSGGFLLVGDSSAQPVLSNANEQAWAVRAGASGSQQWSTTYSQPAGDRFWDVVETDAGDFFCVGQTDASREGVDTALAARLSTDGTVTQTSRYGNDDEMGSTTNSDILGGVDTAPDGTIVAGGLKNLGRRDGRLAGSGWMLTF